MSLVAGVVDVVAETLMLVGVGLLWFYLPYWVYRDARRREMDNAAKWAGFTLIAGFLTIFIYVGMRPLPPEEPDDGVAGS